MVSGRQIHAPIDLFRRIREILVREGPQALVERVMTSKVAKPVRQLFASRTGYWAVRDGYADLADLVKVSSPTIVDGGAYRGRAIDRFLEDFERPTIIAFEPIPELADELRARYEKCPVRVVEKALGSERREVSLQVTQNLLSSSILEPTSLKRSYHGRSIQVHETIHVEEVRLDETIEGPVDVLKLDLQGYELQALRGCGDLLDTVQAILVEVEFARLYEEQPLFADIAGYLSARGFQLYNLYEPYTEPDGRLVWADALFCREVVLEERAPTP